MEDAFKSYIMKRLARQVGLSKALRERDKAENLQWLKSDERILLMRHSLKSPDFYREFLDWLSLNFPGIRSHFELSTIDNGQKPDPAGYRLFVPWLQDPIQQWSMSTYDRACALAEAFKKQGVPVINTPRCLEHSAKSITANVARALGIHAARMIPLSAGGSLDSAIEELGLPLILRSDWGHGGKIFLVDRPGEISGRTVSEIDHPITIEYIDTRGPDGLFRKYRYLAAGDRGINVHLIASEYWKVRGDCKVTNDALGDEEFLFITAPNPHTAIFHRLQTELGFDFVAFDYSYDRQGALVIWEANPYPHIVFGSIEPALRYRLLAIHRSFALMAMFYLTKAKINKQGELETLIAENVHSVAMFSGLMLPA